jgi:hypothetical protein
MGFDSGIFAAVNMVFNDRGVLLPDGITEISAPELIRN